MTHNNKRKLDDVFGLFRPLICNRENSSNPMTLRRHMKMLRRLPIRIVMMTVDAFNVKNNVTCQHVEDVLHSVKYVPSVDIPRVLNVGDMQYETWLALVSKDGFILRHVKEQTPQLCLAAVRQNGEALQFVNNRTLDICMAAVRKNAGALRFMNNLTLDICLAAVKNNHHALEYVPENIQKQHPDICMAAVKSYGDVLCWVHTQTPDICMAAVKSYGYALRWVHTQTPDICMAAVQRSVDALSCVKDQTIEICMAAVQKDAYALKHVLDPQHIKQCVAFLKQTRHPCTYSSFFCAYSKYY